MLCEIHKVEMKQMWKKDDLNHTGDSWFSHKDGESWCNGKEKKVGSNDKIDLIYKMVKFLYLNHPNYEAPKEKPEGDKPF